MFAAAFFGRCSTSVVSRSRMHLSGPRRRPKCRSSDSRSDSARLAQWCNSLTRCHRTRCFVRTIPIAPPAPSLIRRHGEDVALHIIRACPGGRDRFVVEIGSNDGVMLKTLSEAGIRHLGVDPAAGAAEVARAHGVNVRTDFFNASTASEIRDEHGPAHLIYSANTISHISYLDSIFRGADILLAPDGLFVFEDRYLGDILKCVYFDQIYDEHIYLFSVRSVQATAARFGFELIDVEHLPLHGGSIRYTVARAGTSEPSAAVAEFLAREKAEGIADEETFVRFSANIDSIRADLVKLLRDLRADGRRVVGYGATSRSATVMNYCHIGPDLLPMVCDSTPEKQGRLTPGSQIPVCPPRSFPTPTLTTHCCSRGTTPKRSWPKSVAFKRMVGGGSSTPRTFTSCDASQAARSDLLTPADRTHNPSSLDSAALWWPP